MSAGVRHGVLLCRRSNTDAGEEEIRRWQFDGCCSGNVFATFCRLCELILSCPAAMPPCVEKDVSRRRFRRGGYSGNVAIVVF